MIEAIISQVPDPDIRVKLAIYLFHGVTDAPPRPVRNYTRKHLSDSLFDDFISRPVKDACEQNDDEAACAALAAHG